MLLILSVSLVNIVNIKANCNETSGGVGSRVSYYCDNVYTPNGLNLQSNCIQLRQNNEINLTGFYSLSSLKGFSINPRHKYPYFTGSPFGKFF